MSSTKPRMVKSGRTCGFERETVWLSPRQIAVLFKTSTDNVSLHLIYIYKDGELEESATTEDYSAVQREHHRGIRRKLRHYPAAIISVC